MCNIAGYIGKKNAAPILCEMMKKQEGFYAGYYTGIVTHDGTKLCSAKVIGNMDNLLKETDALNFHGTTGFLHSRSKSGGDIQWGHPFLNNSGDLAYIANGAPGYFNDEKRKQERCIVASALEKKGITFPSRVTGPLKDYPLLEDGTAIHISDLQCQYISDLINEGMAVDEAMSYSNTTLPSEIVSLVMRKQNPETIFVTRINAPMMIGIATDGDTYLATTAMAFPEDVTFHTIELLPPVTTVEVFRGGYKVSKYPVKLYNIAPITPDIWYNAYSLLEEFFKDKKDNPCFIQEAIDACNNLWPDGTIGQGAPLVYEIMRSLKKAGKLKIKLIPDEGAFEGYTTNIFKMYI